MDSRKSGTRNQNKQEEVPSKHINNIDEDITMLRRHTAEWERHERETENISLSVCFAREIEILRDRVKLLRLTRLDS